MGKQKGILIKAIKDFLTDNYFYHAAALSYISLMSFFSIFIVVFVIVSYLPFDLSRIVELLSRLFPNKSLDYIRFVESQAKGRATIGIIGFVFAYYFATSLFRQINRALLFVVERSEPIARYWYRHLVSIPALLVVLFLLYVVIISLSGIISALQAFITLPAQLRFLTADVWVFFSYVIDFIVFSVFLFFIYFMYLSNKDKLLPENIIVVSLVNGFILILLKKSFGLVYKWLLKTNPVFGSFATVLFFLLWMYVFFGVFLLGARIIFYSNRGDN